jgi:hypothetical protein
LIRITSPRKVGHGDVLSALILAVWKLTGGSNTMMELLLSDWQPSDSKPEGDYSPDRVRSIG